MHFSLNEYFVVVSFIVHETKRFLLNQEVQVGRHLKPYSHPAQPVSDVQHGAAAPSV